ncbi:DsbA family oxidoreductase [Fodinibius halophilus]|uniref:DsbA family oxidoreductase n=1 Tax=Fodinibius halophilus TaxID=1736908 RepID=A0A6M1T435_9BACT|nr:DsbA family oxidoreductase [Fodinibius halophilus]NGP88849.1 DsbA family oxidoreductase [Fodinibius halophilus]
MKVEIWSDVMCPFCYIGKHRFDQALEQFEYSDRIDIEWRSFLLNPDMETDTEATITEHLAESKGISVAKAKQMGEGVTKMAAEEGLEFNMDTIVVANSFNAHRLVQWAKTHDLGHDAEELLFKNYFTEGANIDDLGTLVEIAGQLDLDTNEARNILDGDKFSNIVKHDYQTAQGMNIQGVPLFLFDRKFVVSGAQETSTFLSALKQGWNNWLEKQQEIQDADIEGVICGPNGSC